MGPVRIPSRQPGSSSGRRSCGPRTASTGSPRNPCPASPPSPAGRRGAGGEAVDRAQRRHGHDEGRQEPAGAVDAPSGRRRIVPVDTARWAGRPMVGRMSMCRVGSACSSDRAAPRRSPVASGTMARSRTRNTKRPRVPLRSRAFEVRCAAEGEDAIGAETTVRSRSGRGRPRLGQGRSRSGGGKAIEVWTAKPTTPRNAIAIAPARIGASMWPVACSFIHRGIRRRASAARTMTRTAWPRQAASRAQDAVGAAGDAATPGAARLGWSRRRPLGPVRDGDARAGRGASRWMGRCQGGASGERRQAASPTPAPSARAPGSRQVAPRRPCGRRPRTRAAPSSGGTRPRSGGPGGSPSPRGGGAARHAGTSRHGRRLTTIGRLATFPRAVLRPGSDVRPSAACSSPNAISGRRARRGGASSGGRSNGRRERRRTASVVAVTSWRRRPDPGGRRIPMAGDPGRRAVPDRAGPAGGPRPPSRCGVAAGCARPCAASGRGAVRPRAPRPWRRGRGCARYRAAARAGR